MAMLRWEPFREMENALRRFSPLYMPDHGVARDGSTTKNWIPLANISTFARSFVLPD